jgi:HK97 family phage major capsid protein
MADGDLANFLAKLEDARDAADERGLAIVAGAEAEGRKRLHAGEARDFDQAVADKKALQVRCDQTRRELDRSGVDNPVLQRIREKETTMSSTTTNPRPSGVYQRHGTNGNSYVRDLIKVNRGMDYDGLSQRRLTQHAGDVEREFRAINRTDGSGGYSSPPLWLMQEYVMLARPGRAFANLTLNAPLPAGTDSINIPKLSTGTTVAFQTGDNGPVSNTDLTDTFVNAPVLTIAGEQDVALQLIDQSPINFDEIVFQDLVAAHAAVLDQAVIAGSGTGNVIKGVHNTAGIQTLTVANQGLPAIYAALANAIQLVHTTRFLPPTVIVMHPRRWGWLLSLLDENQRPLFLPQANGLMNAAGVLEAVESQQVVGQVQGVPVVTDPNIPTNFGGGSNQDPVYVMRARDLYLWETGIRARVLPQTLAQGLTVALQIFSYVAFTAERYPQSVVEIGGLLPPLFTGS